MMHYTISGEGYPVMLVHGFGEDSRIWENQVAILAPHYKVIIPELPGTGNTPIQEELSMEGMADGLHWILEREGIAEITLLGHSMGGYITLAFAEKYPHKLNGYGLLHSTAYADSASKKESRRKSIAFITQHGTEAFLATTTPNLFAEENRSRLPDTINRIVNNNTYILPEALIAFYEAMMARPDRTPVLKASKVPVLFIIGREDQAVAFTDIMQQVHMPEFSYIHILRNTGHMGMLEETQLFTDTILKFMGDQYSTRK